MIKEYNNLLGKKITEQQALQSKEFIVNFIDNLSNLIKEQHRIINEEIFFVDYLLNDNENEVEAFNYLKSKSKMFEIKKRDVVGNYIVYTSKGYTIGEAIAPSIGKTVYNINDPAHVICIQTLDFQTNLPIPDRTVKYWYDINEDGNKYQGIKFYYNEDGSFQVGIDMTPYDSDQQDWDYYSNFQSLQSKKQADLSYYINSNLTP